MSRQNYYAKRRRRKQAQVDEELILGLVKKERRIQPRIGTRKLMELLGQTLALQGVQIGRDRFFRLLGKAGLLVKKKPRRPKTTCSSHSLPVFRNLLREREPTAPHHVWVSDLTYIRTEEGFLYAALIKDLFSHQVVGKHIGDSLEAQGCVVALRKALKQLPPNRFPIHHSDRGSQYCCWEYVEELRSRGLSVSMTEENHCYENASAERLIGILKQEYELDATFKTKRQAMAAFEQAVYLYNHRRPHLSLNYQVPSQAHRAAA